MYEEYDLADLLSFAKAYAKLGWAVQEQLDDLLEGNVDRINPNAVKVMKEELGGKNEELDDIIAIFYQSRSE